MWLVFPVFGIGVAHVVLGPLAIVFALMSRRVIVIAVVGLYFTLGVWPAVPLSITFARARVIDHFERFVEARNLARKPRRATSLSITLKPVADACRTSLASVVILKTGLILISDAGCRVPHGVTTLTQAWFSLRR